MDVKASADKLKFAESAVGGLNFGASSYLPRPSLAATSTVSSTANGDEEMTDPDLGDEHNDFDARYTYRNGNFEKAKGLGWFVTALFVVGDLAGGGIVALPTAVVQAGFFTGMILTVVMSLTVTYTAFVLGRCWVILQRLWPEYTAAHCRKPYPQIGYRALGPRWRLGVSACIDVTQFGIAVVYLLLVSKNLHDFLKAFFDTELGFCVIVIIVAICLLPVTFLKSPQDFWGAVVLAMITTSIAVILIVIGSASDYATCAPHTEVPRFSFTNYFLSLGTFIFAYGGHAAFPTIQHDMRRPHEFTKSSILAFSIMAAMYVPVTVIGWATYGDSLRDSVINSLQVKGIQQSVNMLISIHCVLTLTIVFNPINQEAEDVLRVPHHFCWQRVVVRTGMMAAVVFVAESVPTFGPLLDFVGGSTLCLSSLIFPCLFYLYLSTLEKKVKEDLELAGARNAAYPKGAPIAAITAFEQPSGGILKPRLHSSTDFTPIRTRAPSCPTLFPNNEQHYWPSMLDVIMRTDRATLFCCGFVIAFGVFGGMAATFSAVREMSYAHFTPPCYVTPFLPNVSEPNAGGHTNCCGPWQNISRYPGPAEDYCNAPDHGYYN